MTNLNALTLAATIPVAGLNADVTLDSIVQGSDITTNNVSSSKHGLCPKLPADATKYLDGTGAYSVPAGGGGGVTVLAYQAFTSIVTLTSTTEATGTTVVTAPSFSANGSTLVCVEFFCCSVDQVSANSTVVSLFEGSTQLTRLAYLAGIGVGTGEVPVFARYFYTPTNASHTLVITGFCGSGTARCIAGSGGTAGFAPGYIRVTSGG